MNRYGLTLHATLAAILLGCAQAAAAADGLYLGVGLGAATVKDNFEGSTFEAEDLAYRGILGWRFNQIPLVDLAVEAAYTNFGKPSQIVAPSSGAPAQNVEYKLHGPSLAGLVILPLGPVDLYAKGGVLDWKLDRTTGATTTSRSGSDAFYGVGAGFYLWKLAFRAEYQRFQIKDVDRVEMFTLDALFQF
ncbi:MAG: outer membrane beta-barrel protein [Burkholderiales bacterium]